MNELYDVWAQDKHRCWRLVATDLQYENAVITAHSLHMKTDVKPARYRETQFPAVGKANRRFGHRVRIDDL